MMDVKELNLSDIKKISIEGLKYFHDFCNTKGLKYYLSYGTLLGCIRHKGFIPWDDDVDVLMDRKDYDTLLRYKTEIDNNDWELLSVNTNKDYKFQFAKLCNRNTVYLPSRFRSGLTYGVPIDIFPLDVVNSKNEAILLLKKHSKKLPSFNYLFASNHISILEYVKSIVKILIFGSYNKRCIKFHREMLNKEKEDAFGEYYVSFFAPTFDIYKKDWFSSSMLSEFDNLKLNIPFCYHDILTTTYGNYMELPPKDERVYKHEILAYYQ